MRRPGRRRSSGSGIRLRHCGPSSKAIRLPRSWRRPTAWATCSAALFTTPTTSARSPRCARCELLGTERRRRSTSVPCLVLLGDSIFDNAAYVKGGPDVVSQVRHLLPAGWTADLLAVDGATTEGV